MITRFSALITIISCINYGKCRDEEKIMKACYWPNEVYEPCFGGCAEVSCDNPRNHLRPCYPYCEPGCICEEPYVRDDRTHQCVLPHDCSPTQMGIPVPTKSDRRTNEKLPLPPPSGQKSTYVHSAGRAHSKHDDPTEFEENLSLHSLLQGPSNKEEFKRPDVSRMGNYFNIVIAPPPIKALQPRKIMQHNSYAHP